MEEIKKINFVKINSFLLGIVLLVHLILASSSIKNTNAPVVGPQFIIIFEFIIIICLALLLITPYTKKSFKILGYVLFSVTILVSIYPMLFFFLGGVGSLFLPIFVGKFHLLTSEDIVRSIITTLASGIFIFCASYNFWYFFFHKKEEQISQ